MYLCEATMQAWAATFPGRLKEYYTDKIDMLPISRPMGAMRKMLARKVAKCGACPKKRKRVAGDGGATAACGVCGGGGKLPTEAYYGPSALLLGDGSLAPTRDSRKFLRNIATANARCTIWCPPPPPPKNEGDPPIDMAEPGFKSGGRPAPMLASEPRAQMERMRGEEYAAKVVRQLCTEFKVKEDDARVKDALRLLNKFHTSDRKVAAYRHRELLLPGDPRLEALQRVAPQILSQFLKTERFNCPIYPGAVIVYGGRKPKTIPEYIVFFPDRNRGGDGWCLNRKPEGRFRSEDTAPIGQHSSYKNTWFRLELCSGHQGFPAIQQLCTNPNKKTDGTRFECPCCLHWGGCKRDIRVMGVPKYHAMVAALRNCVVLPSLQTPEESQRWATLWAARSAKPVLTNGVPGVMLVGPDESFNLCMSIALKEDPGDILTHQAVLRKGKGQDAVARVEAARAAPGGDLTYELVM
jgi:hypothetical protein